MTAKVNTHLPLLDEILSSHQELIGKDYPGYRNHCCRMVNFCLTLHTCNEEDFKKIQIAAAFHDIGIWIESTLDYIPPSMPPATAYLKENKLSSWNTEILLMISEHHKLKAFEDLQYPLVETFRQGDLVDFSLGLIKFGINKQHITAVKKEFPNSGFHKGLLQKSLKWFVRHPLNPAPMMKW